MSHSIQLISPTIELEETYTELVNEFQESGEEMAPWVLALKADSFAKLIAMFDGFSQGIGIQPGWVEHSTFWLIDSERRLLGVSNLRHRLNEQLQRKGGHIGYGVRPSQRHQGFATQLLALTLQEAKKLSIDRALLTCDEDNLASAAVIEKNGGFLDSKQTDDNGRVIRRYWINIKTS